VVKPGENPAFMRPRRDDKVYRNEGIKIENFINEFIARNK